MDEYISKRAAYFALKNEADTHELPASKEAYERAARIIDQITPEDVQPVKHGRWSECYTDSHHYSGICTVCGKASIRSIKENPLEYCPKCGARMDGGNEDENSI